MEAGDRMRLQPVQHPQCCLCPTVSLPLCRDSQWINHWLSLTALSRGAETPAWAGAEPDTGTGLLLPKSARSLCHPTVRSRHSDIGQATGHLLGASSHDTNAVWVLTSAWLFLTHVGLNWKAQVYDCTKLSLKCTNYYYHQLQSCLSLALKKDIQSSENNMHVHRKILFLLPWPQCCAKKNTGETEGGLGQRNIWVL